jgi:hypothetical protein
MSATRLLILSERLPDRPPADRVAMIHADVAEAYAKLSRKLTDHASSLHVSGWTDDPDGIQYDVIDSRTVVGRLLLTRLD